MTVIGLRKWYHFIQCILETYVDVSNGLFVSERESTVAWEETIGSWHPNFATNLHTRRVEPLSKVEAHVHPLTLFFVHCTV